MKLSDIQIDYIQNSNADINLATGSIRSGKTFIQLIRWHHFLECEAIENVDCLISAKKGDGAERNIVRPFLQMMETEAPDIYTYTRMPRCLIYKPKNIRCWVEGANDEGSEARIRGMTAQAHLGDEVTLYPKSFLYQAIGRCSAGTRRKFYTCNPDSPTHYIKKEIIDNPNVDKKIWHFNLLDNPSLEPEYKKQLESMYTGVFRQRMIEGLWVQAEGVIYDSFNYNKSVVKDYDNTKIKEYILGIDWGYEHPLAMLLIAIDLDDSYYVIDEIYRQHQLIDESLKKIMEAKGWFNLKHGTRQVNINFAYCDTNRPEQMLQFNRLTNIPSMGASKEVLDGIQSVQSLMTIRQNQEPRLYILDKCINLLKEINSYSWKQSKSGIGKDEPIKENDDACVIGNTKVLTFLGYKKIKNIKEGEYVFNNSKFCKVLKVHNNGLKKVKKRIIGTKKIECTDDHRIYTNNRGYIEASLLTDRDTYCIININKINDYLLCKRKMLMKLFIEILLLEGTQNLKIIKNTIQQMGLCQVMEFNFCIDINMNVKLEKYQKILTYTILTAIRLIILLIILLQLIGVNIYLFTQKIIIKIIKRQFLNIYQIYDHLQKNGTQAKKVLNGIQDMEKKCGLTKRSIIKFVKYVAKSMKHISLMFQNIAIIIAKLKHSEKEEKKKVYDLTIEKDSSYFANGILIHNCDSLRYAIHTREKNRPRMLKKDPFDIWQ